MCYRHLIKERNGTGFTCFTLHAAFVAMLFFPNILLVLCVASADKHSILVLLVQSLFLYIW